MAKDTYFFSHDYNARNDEKILDLRSAFGAEGYGVFWMIVETMAENQNGGVKATLIGGLSLGYGVAKDRLLSIIDHCKDVGLFYETDGFIYSKRLLNHKEFMKQTSEWGKQGALKRWATHSPPNSPSNAKERKGKESKGNTNTGGDGEKKTELGEEHYKQMLIQEMLAIWKKHNPTYQDEDTVDFPALLSLAYKIAKAKGWRQAEVVNGKLDDVLKSWTKVVEFVRADNFYKKLDLPMIEKKWSGVYQSMLAANEPTNTKETKPKMKYD